jgi:hypothetical protein
VWTKIKYIHFIPLLLFSVFLVYFDSRHKLTAGDAPLFIPLVIYPNVVLIPEFDEVSLYLSIMYPYHVTEICVLGEAAIPYLVEAQDVAIENLGPIGYGCLRYFIGD